MYLVDFSQMREVFWDKILNDLLMIWDFKQFTLNTGSYNQIWHENSTVIKFKEIPSFNG